MAKGFPLCSAPHVPSLLQGIGTDEKCLIEILASRTNEQMHQLVAAYKDGEVDGTARVEIPRLISHPPSF